MNSIKSKVKILTVLAGISLCSCSFVYDRYGESCKSHAYLHRGLHEFINSRFHYNSQVRMAVIPFSVPANLSAIDSERPGLGNQIAWQVHGHLLKSGEVPIVEVFNRQDWPYKKEEFFTGNFGGISMAREAGYDLLLVGSIEPSRDRDEMISHVKILEVESGITVYYGKISTSTLRRNMHELGSKLWLNDEVPSLMYTDELTQSLARCIIKAVLADPDE